MIVSTGLRTTLLSDIHCITNVTLVRTLGMIRWSRALCPCGHSRRSLSRSLAHQRSRWQGCRLAPVSGRWWRNERHVGQRGWRQWRDWQLNRLYKRWLHDGLMNWIRIALCGISCVASLQHWVVCGRTREKFCLSRITTRWRGRRTFGHSLPQTRKRARRVKRYLW